VANGRGGSGRVESGAVLPGVAPSPESGHERLAERGTEAASVWQVLAAGVLYLHLSVSVFIVLGGLLVARGMIAWWVHVPFAAWGALVHAANITCPLTPLEKYFRRRGGQRSYEAGFVARYLAPPSLRGRRLDAAVVALILVANALIYGLLIL
jgi:hypothetical protein